MIKRFNTYIEKHNDLAQQLDLVHESKSDIVVVIPVYLEDRLIETLNSLINANRQQINVAVYLVINAVKGASDAIIEQQEASYQQLLEIAKQHINISIIPIKAFDLPEKHFGAGLARKIGMDEAIRYFNKVDAENGIIVSLDADSLVDENYFTSIVHFFKNKNAVGCSINFAHPTTGDDFDTEIYDAITQYELHLRYYVEALKYIGFPHAYHTVGSCFAVTADAYVRVGGMNRRQGGEEFYFIQKVLQIGEYGNLNSTTVYPSPRISTRVPFGTGPSIKKIVEEETDEFETYNLQAFIDLKVLFDNTDKYYKINEADYQKEILNLPGRVRSFLLNSDFFTELDNLNRNCANLLSFTKRFYQIFSAFRLVKYINYTHEHFIEKVPVSDAAIDLLELMDCDTDDIFDNAEILEFYREFHKK